MRFVNAGIAYWAVVFALGFVLGTIRVLWFEPLMGRVPATALELPLILAASWVAAGWLVRRFGISAPTEALAMGGFAFALLLAAEYALAAGIMGQTLTAWLSGLQEPHAMIGLAGQVAFALLPSLRVRRGLNTV